MIKHMQSGMIAKTHNKIRGRGIMKSETNKESKYPMTYEEYEKRVIELFLEEADSPKDLEFRRYLLNEYGDDIIMGEYEDACYYYYNPEYSCNQFTEERLLSQPVRILEMI